MYLFKENAYIFPFYRLYRIYWTLNKTNLSFWSNCCTFLCFSLYTDPNKHEALVNSLFSETESYRHFRDYLVSGNKTEDDLSTDLLSQAFQYEQIYSKFLSMSFPNPQQNVTKRINYTY